MKYLNLNALQSLLTAALAAVPVIFVSFGCTEAVTGAFDCSASSFFTPKIGLVATGILTFCKLFLIPALQPGGLVRNLVEPKAPISGSGATGTVRPDQVKT